MSSFDIGLLSLIVLTFGVFAAVLAYYTHRSN